MGHDIMLCKVCMKKFPDISDGRWRLNCPFCMSKHYVNISRGESWDAGRCLIFLRDLKRGVEL